MTKQEVIDRIGVEKWEDFCKFMWGQTMGINKDGSLDYFECDVYNFLCKPKDRFFD
jgi:hypothetical protein